MRTCRRASRGDATMHVVRSRSRRDVLRGNEQASEWYECISEDRWTFALQRWGLPGIRHGICVVSAAADCCAGAALGSDLRANGVGSVRSCQHSLESDAQAGDVLPYPASESTPGLNAPQCPSPSSPLLIQSFAGSPIAADGTSPDRSANHAKRAVKSAAAKTASSSVCDAFSMHIRQRTTEFRCSMSRPATLCLQASISCRQNTSISVDWKGNGLLLLLVRATASSDRPAVTRASAYAVKCLAPRDN